MTIIVIYANLTTSQKVNHNSRVTGSPLLVTSRCMSTASIVLLHIQHNPKIASYIDKVQHVICTAVNYSRRVGGLLVLEMV